MEEGQIRENKESFEEEKNCNPAIIFPYPFIDTIMTNSFEA